MVWEIMGVYVLVGFYCWCVIWFVEEFNGFVVVLDVLLFD